jgi:nucleoside-diphosphate-sugar epimerase
MRCFVTGTTYPDDKAQARRELGYAPRPVRAGLAETLEDEMKTLGID